MEAPPDWLQTFLNRLAADDLSAATRRGYRYDLLHFVAWYTTLNNAPRVLARLTEHDLMMASPLADNVSRPAAPLSANPSRNPLCLRARAPMIASATRKH
ncbi:MAG: hypothetical protein ACREFP_02220 [Acetobacteraceae bacterium]